MELHSLALGVRLAIRLGYAFVTLISDSEVAIVNSGSLPCARVAGIHCIICWSRPLSQAQS